MTYKKGDKVILIKSPSIDYPLIYNNGSDQYFKLGEIYTVEYTCVSSQYPDRQLVNVIGNLNVRFTPYGVYKSILIPVDCLEKVGKRQ